jgi:hypothetical protein
MKMNKTQFIDLINQTSFDQETKNLFITSYSLGYTQGKFDQMETAIEILTKQQFKGSENVIV